MVADSGNQTVDSFEFRVSSQLELSLELGVYFPAMLSLTILSPVDRAPSRSFGAATLVTQPIAWPHHQSILKSFCVGVEATSTLNDRVALADGVSDTTFVPGFTNVSR
jgi:hypothetical protein